MRRHPLLHHHLRNAWPFCALAALAVCLAGYAVEFPPLTTEISAEHPFFMFQAAPGSDGLTAAWRQSPGWLRPFSAFVAEGDEATLRAVLEHAKEEGVPVVIGMGGSSGIPLLTPDRAETLLGDFPNVKGILVKGLDLNAYPSFAGGDVYNIPPPVRWLTALLDMAPRYGRFVAIEMDGLMWTRAMANPACKPLYDAMRGAKGYAIPMAAPGARHYVTRLMSVYGLWLEGAAANWGVTASSRWYAGTQFVRPGVFGPHPAPSSMPPSRYRNMVFNGAMTGAVVYYFDTPDDLWPGANHAMWDSGIAPALKDLLDFMLIAPRSLALKKTRAAFQLAPAPAPDAFMRILRELDAECGEGWLPRAAYGVERPGQIAELIPDTGERFWIPVLSPYASGDFLKGFSVVRKAGETPSREAWASLLDGVRQPDGEGGAFIARVGRGLFIMNTRENTIEDQEYRVPDMPAPVRGVQAARQTTAIQLTWPEREGDIAFKVYKRVPPAREFQLTARDLETGSWTDPNVDAAIPAIYAVTALTNEMEPLEGVVGFGGCLGLSAVESRILEEVLLNPADTQAVSVAIESQVPPMREAIPWWPSIEGLPSKEQQVAMEVADRIVRWDHAVQEEDLETIMDLYAPDYKDPQGWDSSYARRAWQWFFERYDSCRMDRQIRRWELGPGSPPDYVTVVLYCRFNGCAISSPDGSRDCQEAWFPQHPSGEIRCVFVKTDGAWRLTKTDPALPNFAELLGFSAGPYDEFTAGPDIYAR